MTAPERYEHLLSVVDAQICTEAFKVSQYETVDPETAAEAQVRWDDWALLSDAIGNGLMEKLASESEQYKALAGSAVSR